MRIYFLLLLFFTSIHANTIDPYKNIEYFQLENGMEVYLNTDKRAVNTKISLEVNVGWSVEDDNNSGLSHLLEHLIFRDQRIAHNDYVDYLKDEGATYVNGYTSRFETGYVATIDAKKSYFIVEAFSKMMFDKNVTVNDLEIEKRALQNEIGEVQWFHPFTHALSRFFNFLGDFYPEQNDIFRDSFSLEDAKKEVHSYFTKSNNSKFTLDDVLNHYETYYYPKNMILKVAGNFDSEKMKEIIKDKYGPIVNVGTKKAQELKYNAKLKAKPYRYISVGEGSGNTAYIGARILLHDYKKYLILRSYVDSLASKMQQLLRNKLGKTYSVRSYFNYKRDAGMIGVNVDSLHDDFKENIALIQKQIQEDVKGMSEKDIKAALETRELKFASIEHDSNSLLASIDTQEHLKKYYNITDMTQYQIFQEISVEEFQKVVSETFIDKYSYLYEYNDYMFFNSDTTILVFLMLGLIIYYSSRQKRTYLLNSKVSYTKRDVVFSRRITSKFVSFITLVVLFYIAIGLSEWVKYSFFFVLYKDPYYLFTLNSSFDLLVSIVDFSVFLLIFIALQMFLMKKFYTRIDVLDERLLLVSSSLEKIEKEDILVLKKVDWNFSKYFEIYGTSILFWKPLVMIQTKEKTYYIRAQNAGELLEDLTKWKEK